MHFFFQVPGQTKPTPIVKTLRYHDFVSFAKFSTPLKVFDVSPCLNISKNDSYLVAFGNGRLFYFYKTRFTFYFFQIP